jgi:hypothetical protein
MRILKKKMLFLIISLCLNISILHGIPFHIFAQQKALIFSTWEGFEADKCASIWLIKRFIDKNAIIKFFPKGEIIKEGIPFDTPDAKFRRYHNLTTFGSLLKHYHLQDPKLIYIGRIIHDIEINIWERKVMSETYKVQEEIDHIIRSSRSNDEVIEKSCRYFNLLYHESMNRIKQ